MEEVSGSIYFRPLGNVEGLAPGQEIKGDLHTYDHTTVLFNGHWQVVIERRKGLDGDDWEIVRRINAEGPFHFLVEANCRHSFKYFGETMPVYLEMLLANMPHDSAEEFRRIYQNRRGRGWCVYSRSSGAGWGPYT